MTEGKGCINANCSLSLRTDGSVCMCCMSNERIKKENGDPFIVGKDAIEDIFNSSHLKKIRKSLQDGIKHTACIHCWDEEAAGRESKRIRDNKNFNNYLEENSIKILEVFLGNTCNLKCRTCNLSSSTQWVREHFDLYVDKDTISWEEFASAQKEQMKMYDQDSPFWKDIFDKMKNIEHIYFFGGEPFLIKKHWELIKFCVNNGYSHNQTLFYNTNGTIWVNDEQLNLLKSFKKVFLTVSVDGIEEQSNYIRFPTKWYEVHENILRWQEFKKDNKNINLILGMTISPFNIFYIDTLIEYAKKLNIPLYINLVHYPEHYNIQNIPSYFKDAVIEKLSPYKKENEYLNGVLKFMTSQDCDYDIWRKFKETVNITDEYRKQSFSNVFPEIVEIMKNHGDNL